MKRVLVTGAKGFIGKPCIEALQNRNFEIHALSSLPVLNNSAGIHWHQTDLHDAKSVRKLLADIHPSHLLHLAWYVEHGRFWSSSENIRWVNSSIELIKGFISNGGQRLICLGTCAEYDWTDKSCSTGLVENTSPINPATVYGASKSSLCMTAKALCHAKGISFAWGRLFFPYGPYEPPQRLIPNTIKTLLQGNVSICKHPDLLRDFIFVQDIAQILAMLLDSELVGPINIASGQASRLKDITETIAKLLDAKNLIQYGSEKSTDPPAILADITRLKNELGFKKFTTIENGLEQTIAWWQKNI